MGYLKPDGSYYQGDRAHALDIEVPQRPSQFHTWKGEQWVLSTEAAAQLQNAPIDAEIAKLEAEQAQVLTPRALREFVLRVTTALKLPADAFGTTLDALAGIDAQIVDLRDQRVEVATRES